MKTYHPTAETVTRDWYIVDASDVILGKLAVKVADVLRGKNLPNFSPSVDCGGFVVVINAEKIKVSGNKETDKIYYHHSGFPHGFKQETLKSLRARRPEAIIERAVRGMLPHNRLGDQQFTKLKVYAGSNHPHAAQMPKELKVTV